MMIEYIDAVRYEFDLIKKHHQGKIQTDNDSLITFEEIMGTYNRKTLRCRINNGRFPIIMYSAYTCYVPLIEPYVSDYHDVVKLDIDKYYNEPDFRFQLSLISIVEELEKRITYTLFQELKDVGIRTVGFVKSDVITRVKRYKEVLS